MEFISVVKEGPVSIMTMNHEEQNRFTTPFMQEIIACLMELENDAGALGVVVTGAQEKYFSTGLHLEYLISQGTKDLRLLREFLSLVNQLCILTTGFKKPLVAAINGHVVAMGCIFAACMDYRLMREDFGFVRLPEVQIDIPFWPGMIAIFKDIVPPKSFRDMAYIGDRFTSRQAKEMGYIDELYPKDRLLPAAVELASKLGIANTDTYTIIKRDLRHKVLESMKNDDPKAIEAFISRFKSSPDKG